MPTISTWNLAVDANADIETIMSTLHRSGHVLSNPTALQYFIVSIVFNCPKIIDTFYHPQRGFAAICIRMSSLREQHLRSMLAS